MGAAKVGAVWPEVMAIGTGTAQVGAVWPEVLTADPAFTPIVSAGWGIQM